jgi:CARDB protein
MRSRWTLPAGLLGLLCVLIFAAAAAAAAAAPVAQLQEFTCMRALDPLERSLSVTAVMRPLSGTVGMQLRFDLLRSAHRYGVYRAVRGKNLGSWMSPADPTLGQQPADTWVERHPVVGLPAPAFYRLRVTFRWLGPSGRRIGQQVRTTPICHQLELRPDLLVGSLRVFTLTTQPGQYGYVAAIRDHGLTGAGPFEVELSGPGTAPLTRTIAWLAPHSARRLRFVAPACTAGTPLTMTVDPGATVEDLDRSNNTLTVPCPANPPGYTP